MASSITIPADHGQLEARLEEPDTRPRGIAVVCHPHPQHGGTMHTKAVYHTAKALLETGCAVLRFHFRGVGQSTGSYDDGVGEREDCRTATEWLRNRYPELPLILGGFSFGSMVALSLLSERNDIHAAIGVGLPLTLYDFSHLDDISIPTLLIQGERDEFGPASDLQDLIKTAHDQITINTIAGAGHFLTDHYADLRLAIQNFFSTDSAAAIFGDGSPRHGRGIP